jgi:hypothetical protein
MAAMHDQPCLERLRSYAMNGEPLPNRRWWEVITRIEQPSPVTIRARAADLVGRTQSGEATWNRVGYGSNSIEKIVAHVR